MLQHWIWLATRKNLSDRCKVALLEQFHDPEQIYFAAQRDYSSCSYVTPGGLQSLLDKDLSESEKILSDCAREKIHVMTIHDGSYPGSLKNIPDPPVVLYYKGHFPDLDATPAIGVVGTREATPYGLLSAKKLGYQIAACGGIVVSGLAKGIDAMAMQGALSAGMDVVGVLGCGVDIVYPPVNRALFADTENYGCILSEFPPKTPPYPQNFPQRNRIISGLSDGVLVVEAPARSGALITAQLAADQGRDVFIIPANIDVPASEGSNSLVRDGAIMVMDGGQIMSEYTQRYPGKIHPAGKGKPFRLYPQELDDAQNDRQKPAQRVEKPAAQQADPDSKKKKGIDNRDNEPYSDLTKNTFSLSEHEQIIFDRLRGGRKLVDDLIEDCGLSVPLVLASLTMLEVKRIVRRLPGRYIELTGESE